MAVNTCYKNVVLQNQGLECIPKKLYESTELEILHLGENAIGNLSSDFGKLQNLVELNLGKNRIKELPQNVSALARLRKLHLGDNEISSIEGVESLDSLEELFLGNNRIVELPIRMGSLPKLKVLHLGTNPIEKLPVSLAEPDQLNLFLHSSQESVIPEGFKGRVHKKTALKHEAVEASCGKLSDH